MIYQDYMRRKMHNVVKLDTKEGYPLTVYSCANTNLKDYTIYGNTGGVGDKTENLFDISKSDGFTSQYTGLTNTITDNVITVSSTVNRIGYLTLGTFEAGTYYIGMTSEDYTDIKLIIVNDVNSKISVNNLITISERSVIKIMISMGAGTTWHFTNIQITKSNVATSYEPYNKYKIPITVTGKNLFDIDTFLALNGNLTYYSKNENGELVQVKGDFRNISVVSTITTLPAGTYTLSISNTNVSSFYIIINGKSNGVGKTSFTLTEASDIGLKFYESAGTILGYIQIELGSSATSYEPYHEPVTTNIYRDAQLGQGESINYKSDNLPDITLKKGTNIITADTEVKPSSIKIKYLKK